MAKQATTKDAPDVLDEIREVDKAVRRALLIKVLSHLKYISRKILRYKLLISEELKAMGMSDEDTKRIIDFINESTEVKLTDEEKKEIQRDAKDSIRDKKKSIEGEMEKRAVPNSDNVFYANLGTAAPNQNYNQADNFTYTTSNSGDLLLKGDAGSELEVKL